MFRVYISAHCPKLAADLAAKLKAAGHEVVSTWHDGASPKVPMSDVATWGDRAVKNFDAIEGAESLALIAGPDRYPGGKFVEAGYALSIGVQVYTVGGVENGMLLHPEVAHVKDAAELVEMLAS